VTAALPDTSDPDREPDRDPDRDANRDADRDRPFRLPDAVRPSHYDLDLQVDLDGASFDGEVAVRVEVSEPITAIVLNAVDLTVHEAWVVGADGGRIDAAARLE